MAGWAEQTEFQNIFCVILTACASGLLRGTIVFILMSKSNCLASCYDEIKAAERVNKHLAFHLAFHCILTTVNE